MGTVGLWAQAETWAWRVQVPGGIHVQHTAHQAHSPHQSHGVHTSPRCWTLQAWRNYSPGLLALIDAFQLTIERSAPYFKIFFFFFFSPCIGFVVSLSSLHLESTTVEFQVGEGWSFLIKCMKEDFERKARKDKSL